ncbi:hypothetical protein DYB28_012112 [Aphanomyces astaci]|uniref:histone acetyltransferase n=1 Tax=Aphanomyces astaci TaxID=112090 RepID=A0A9X8H8M0_APHAT|nr:hypothetical protein DYB28_012112 [Aphanomyces astaci]
MKRPRSSCYEADDSPIEVECEWEMGKLSVVPPVDITAATTTSPTFSPLDTASATQLRQHLQDLQREQMAVPMLGVVTRLMIHRINQSFFNTPVDVVRLACPTYYDVIKAPMDLGTIKQRLGSLEYANPDDAANDIRLVFQNAMLFNPPGHVVHDAAAILLKEFEREYVVFLRKQADRLDKRNAHSCPHCQSHVCALCNEKCINFDPPLVMCVGKCGQRLRRHAAYFTTLDRQLNWCAKCVPKLKEVVVAGRKIGKRDLVKAKFQDELTEPWVQCDSCTGWVHQICALFNASSVEADDDDTPYTCPICRLNKMEAAKAPESPLSLPPLSPCAVSSNELDVVVAKRSKHDEMSTHSPVVKKQRKPHCYPKATDTSSTATSHLGTFMETWIRDHMIALGEPHAATSISVKLAASIRKTVPINPRVQEHIVAADHSTYPSHVTYTSKTILVFQKIHGIDVCLFSMYVQEYGDNCGVSSNVKRTYIAYLDSLGYFRPRHARSSVYQQLVIAYLAFCKLRGFTHAHIWACPTTRGGDFIYWCHPTYQRNPNKDRLLLWYKAIIASAKRSHVAFGHDTLWSTHFQSSSAESFAVLPPYFEGDYWVAEADRIAGMRPRKVRRKKTEPHVVAMDQVAPLVKSDAAIRVEVAASVASAKDSLFVILLQPACVQCRVLVVNAAYWKSDNDDNNNPLVWCDMCHNQLAALNDANGRAFQQGGRHVLVSAEPWSSKLPPPPHGNGMLEVDDVDEISCPLVNHRSELLKQCEEHHYQFDTFRRAKYSTMMLLHHLKGGREV